MEPRAVSEGCTMCLTHTSMNVLQMDVSADVPGKYTHLTALQSFLFLIHHWIPNAQLLSYGVAERFLLNPHSSTTALVQYAFFQVWILRCRQRSDLPKVPRQVRAQPKVEPTALTPHVLLCIYSTVFKRLFVWGFLGIA